MRATVLCLLLLIAAPAWAQAPIRIGLGDHPNLIIKGDAVYRFEHDGYLEILIEWSEPEIQLDVVVSDGAGTGQEMDQGLHAAGGAGGIARLVTHTRGPSLIAIRAFHTQHDGVVEQPIRLRLQQIEVRRLEPGGSVQLEPWIGPGQRAGQVFIELDTGGGVYELVASVAEPQEVHGRALLLPLSAGDRQASRGEALDGLGPGQWGCRFAVDGPALLELILFDVDWQIVPTSPYTLTLSAVE